MIKRFGLWLLPALVLLVAGHKAAMAASPQGVTVSPAFQQVTIAPGVQQQPVNFTITNDQSLAQTFSLSAADFNTLGESGGLFFVGTNPTDLQKKYGLAKWFSLPQDSVTLQPKQSQTIQAEILNLPDLAPGGHYGALMLSSVDSSGTPGSNNVRLHPIASSLMFVTKLGGDTHTLDLNGVSTNRNSFRLPTMVNLRFHNTGNSHVVPRGVIKLTTAGGQLVRQGIINEDSNIILPQTFRQISVPLTNVISGGGPYGRYQLAVDFRLDGFDRYREFKTSFWRIDPKFILGIALLIAAAAVLVKKRRDLRK